MKKKFLYPIILIVLFFGQFLFAQNPGGIDQSAAIRNAKSIHQIEWEQYKNFVPSEKPPVFTGKPMPLQPRRVPPSREVFGYLPYWVYNSYPTLNYDLLTTIAYFGVDINELGDIVSYHNWPAGGLINLAHSKGVRVVLTVILFDGSKLATLLNSSANRTNLINNLLSEVQIASADGVSIDFEGVPSGQRQNMTDFMTELSTAFHTTLPGSFVTIFSPAVDWRNVFDYLAISQVADGLIMQGYDYHWGSGPTAGPTAPLTSGSVWGTYNVTWTVDDYLAKTFQNRSKLILSVPFYGFEWKTATGGLASPTIGSGTAIFYSTAYPNAMQYGRLWDTNSQTPWYKYNDGNWHQGWYDDSLSLGLKFNLVNQENLKGTAIWALSYDGQRLELQQALANAFGSTAPPLKPTDFRITNLGNGAVQVTVNTASGATGYRLYRSYDGVNFDQGSDFPTESIVLSNLSTDTTYYFKMSAINGNGESNLTEVLAVRPSATPIDVLIVNGFDRTSGTVNTFDYIKRFAPSLDQTGHAFDSAANEAVEDSLISLLNYDIVLWILGEEGTANESFSNTEQTRVVEFLENGGKLFVSGSEIGYDLVEKGSSSDKQFYRNYLKAQYVMDRVPVYAVSGQSNSIFANLLSITFDNGSHGTYNVDYPDGINPIDGSLLCLSYDGWSPNFYGGAGIQYQGTFGQGTTPGKLVYLAVPFETFYPATTRDSIMADVIRFFDASTGIPGLTEQNLLPGDFALAQNYPNPFNPSTTIRYTLTNFPSLPVTLEIYDLLGRKIRTLVNERLSAGKFQATWDGRDATGKAVSSGVYVYRLQVGNHAKTRKMMLVR